MMKPAILTVQPLSFHPPHDEAINTYCAVSMLSPLPPHDEASNTQCAATMLSPLPLMKPAILSAACALTPSPS